MRRAATTGDFTVVGITSPTKLMWNPQADAGALLTDFYDKAFGAGAAAMRRYYDRLDAGNKPLLSQNLLARAFRDIDEASRLTRDQPDIQARLDDIKHYLRYLHLTWMLDHAPNKARKKELTLVALVHSYRTRYSYMNHWEAMRQAWLPQAAAEFDGLGRTDYGRDHHSGIRNSLYPL